MTTGTTMHPTKTAPRERLVPNPKARLREQLHEVCRFKHLSPRTEESYWGWLRRFLVFHKQGAQWRHPKELGGAEVQAYLSHLATDRDVAANVPPISTRLQPGVRAKARWPAVSTASGKRPGSLRRQTVETVGPRAARIHPAKAGC